MFQDGTNADQAFVGMADDSRVGFWGNTGANWGLTMDTGSGEVVLSNDLTVSKTADGTASFTHRAFANEGSFTPNNLKLEMASRSTFLGGPLRFEFMVGYSHFRFLPNFGIRTDFIRVFGVDQDGRAFFSGGRAATSLTTSSTPPGTRWSRGTSSSSARSSRPPTTAPTTTSRCRRST